MRRWIAIAMALGVAACGARTNAALDESPRGRDGAVAGPDAGADAALPDAGADAGLDAAFDGGCVPLGDGCLPVEACGDGGDDDCDGLVDEGCPCEPGAVQACFGGPPARRGVGACQDGSQVCLGSGTWGPCAGGILPSADACTGRDDLCDGCSDARICPIDCPSPGDPRVPDGQPFRPYPLAARDFYAGPADGFRWVVEGGPCDDLAPNLTSFELSGAREEVAVLTPRLSGDYRVTLRVLVPGGERLACSWLVHVEGPGLRVEMCYPESETEDLDLFLHRPDDTTDWYPSARATAHQPLPEASCGWHNCEATLRMPSHPVTGAPVGRADWGYPPTPLERCENGPLGDAWRALGECANPRLDIDNNLSEGIGVPENVNVDNPRDGETFRIMVQSFTGGLTRPVVNVYCGGRRVATFGRAPDEVRLFRGPSGNRSIGAMWRVADVTVAVDPSSGETIGCDVRQLHRPGLTTGYHLTLEDPTY
ncbi:MAG: hypothetical protein KF729_00560 [Sandaracinaceae bacterium]|nr:hypothetical protein [Sandaracinaceae bacterium]